MGSRYLRRRVSKPDERPSNPFARLRDVLGPLPPGPTRDSAAKPDATGFPHSGERLSLRFERAGRGGKTVTCVEGPALRGVQLDSLAKEIARALGVGARAESDQLVVQGEQCARLVEWLIKRGFGDVRRGN